MNIKPGRTTNRFPLAPTAALVFVLSNGLWLNFASAATLESTKVLFTDSTGDKIRSDGFGYYTDQVDCVRSYTNHEGKAFMRTGQKVSFCPSPGPAQPRELVLDFSAAVPGSGPANCDPVLDPSGSGFALDVCGSNSIPDAKILGENPFYRTNPTTSAVTVSFNIGRPPTFPDTSFAFSLEFEQPVPTTGAPSSSRTLTAGSTAVAELYKFVPNGRRVTKVSIGRYYMPFQVTYTKLQ